MQPEQAPSRSQRQWEAVVRQRIRRGDAGHSVLADLAESGVPPDQARRLVDEAIASARRRGMVTAVAGAVLALLGIGLTAASYSSARHSYGSGVHYYWVWWGAVVAGAAVLVAGLVRLSRVRS